MNKARLLNQVRRRRGARNRAKIFGTKERPRLAVFRSNRFIHVQLIDDEEGFTVAVASSRELSEAGKKRTKTEQAALVGKLLAERARELGIKSAVFDRRRYNYHGRVRSLAEAARKSGFTI